MKKSKPSSPNPGRDRIMACAGCGQPLQGASSTATSPGASACKRCGNLGNPILIPERVALSIAEAYDNHIERMARAQKEREDFIAIVGKAEWDRRIEEETKQLY